MPELPEVETVRRMLEAHVLGRVVREARVSRERLRDRTLGALPRALAGRRIERVRRHGKVLLADLDGGRTLLSHLGMSGRWLFFPEAGDPTLAHVHLRATFEDGARLWFQDPRRFGMLRVAATAELARDPSLASLGPDPIADPPDGARLHALARGARTSVKSFLLDQRRIAGIGNIYASEILFRARVSPSRRAGALARVEWDAVARETLVVLHEAIEGMGTTFSMYRTLWGEPGGYGEQLRVYDRVGEPCTICGAAIRRLVQSQRSTFFCPRCQRGRGGTPRRRPRTGVRGGQD